MIGRYPVTESEKEQYENVVSFLHTTGKSPSSSTERQTGAGGGGL